MLNELAERLAWHIDARENVETRCRPSVDAALENRHVGIAVAGKDRRGAFGSAVMVVAQHDARRTARHQPGEFQLEPAQRYGARQKQMALRKDQLFANIDKRQLTAVADHTPQRSGACCWRHVAICGVIGCTSPVFRSKRTRVILSRLVPVTRMKRE
jgi:hypothetical protein